MTYRPDIDGLRAIAVLAVVIFHLDVPGFEGGYVGVDVFFVISGFLITSIIVRDCERQRFSFGNFYLRRIRRLGPPLVATVAAATLASSFILTPYDMIAYARSAVAALFSLSNIVFFSESGYWDTASELKPLLHTWSLGVEEQFYLFWPALIVALVSSRWLNTYAAIAVIGLLSLAGCIWYSYVDVSAAFYLSPFRVFQFALGALVIPLLARANGLSPQRRRTISVLAFPAGLTLVLYSTLTFGDVLFPGWAVLVPTLGSCLLLLAGGLSDGLPNSLRMFVENRVSVWLGQVSYSMYLVHWPLVSLYRYQAGRELLLSDQVLLAVATFLLTVVLHYGVEKRFYQRAGLADAGAGTSHTSWLATGTVAAAIAVGAISATAWLDGWSWRYPDLALTPDVIATGKQDRFTFSSTGCGVNRLENATVCDLESRPVVLVFGNSHEPDGFNFLRGALFGKDDVTLVSFGTTNQCKGLALREGRFITENERCQKRLDAMFSPRFLQKVDMVVYASNRPFARNKAMMVEVLRSIRAVNPAIKVTTLGGYINTRTPCATLINQEGSSTACAERDNVSYFPEKLASGPLYEQIAGLTDLFIDRIDLLCTDRVVETCLTRTDDGFPAFYDTHHNSRQFAEMAGRLYEAKYPGRLFGDLQAR